MADDRDVIAGGRASARTARAPATRCRSGARGRGRRTLQRLGEDDELLAAAAPELDDQRHEPIGPIRRALDDLGAWRSSSRRSARVMRYHGSRQIASNRLEPSAS